MKRGIEILIYWLVVIVAVDFFLPTRSIPRTSLEGYCHLFALLLLPCAPWFYARHSGRWSPVICYGLIAGVYCVFVPLPIFHNPRGLMRRELTAVHEFMIFAVPILMVSVCVGLCALRRYLDRDDEQSDA
jgi:hypothetical protein